MTQQTDDQNDQGHQGERQGDRDDRDDHDKPARRPGPAPREVRVVAALARGRARLTREEARAVRDLAATARSGRAGPARTTAPPRPPGAAAPPANRALAARGLLGDLWGDELPPSADPWLTLVQDVLAVDDDAGRERGFAVYADAVALGPLTDVLVEALAGHPRAAVLLSRLPVVLREPVCERLAQFPDRERERSQPFT
ncbi:hypothetical protein AB2L27_00955 [Kineococcus sp. LSe6-4]|uniref:DUF2267 domain-containing protein n=1 Tax=Kineococcus halophytocola TaxID=3234027 RepID=A0ABV4GYS2_9ACTN